MANTNAAPPAPESAKVAPVPPSKGKGAPKASAAPSAAPTASQGDSPAKPKKPRAPRKDYGYSPASIIKVDKEKEVNYKGKRGDYYKLLVANDGKTVNDFEGAAPAGDSPRGWLRFFVQDGACSLERPVEKK
jgi:hypothetical protein